MARSGVLKPISLFPSTTVTGTTKSAPDTAAYGSTVNLRQVVDQIQGLVLILDVTAAAKESGDKLDVIVQSMLDNVNWVDVCYFTQILGNGGAKRIVAKLLAATAETLFADAALTAGNIRHLFGDAVRVKYLTTNDSDDPVDTAFTFAVYAIPM